MIFMKPGKPVLVVWLCILIISCDNTGDHLFEFKNPESTGIVFENRLDPTPQWNILSYLNYYNGAGLAVADFNNDQLPDIYFVANQGDNHLYINRGDWKFTEHAQKAGVQASQGWKTGVTVVDINSDGWMDIYLSELGRFKHIDGKNKLFVNRGAGPDGVPVFSEAAAEYGIDLKTFATQATFFDFDLDGDLDLFQLNHSVHPIRNYGNGKQRLVPDSLAGDRFFRNDGGKFTEITSETGIFTGKSGYGLGLSVSDLNNDGYPDLYVGNDFYENDYLYLNNRNGTFREVIHQNNLALGHTTHSSMGNSVADLNNDGLTDIVSLDMLAEDRVTFKSAAPEYPYQVYHQYMQNGYDPQYIQNTFHLNLGNANFSEIAYLAGIYATEWSWTPVPADFDNDGHTDLYITNGIPAATNDLDYINFISNQQIQMRLAQGMDTADMDLIRKIPDQKTVNYFFRNRGDLTFENSSASWAETRQSYSNSALAADFDNDGDLDLVVNNINEKAFLLENKSEQMNPENHFLKVVLSGTDKKPQAIGARVLVYVEGEVLTRENHFAHGYLSAQAGPLHFGLGPHAEIDSLKVVWPDGSHQLLTGVKADQEISIKKADATPPANKTIAGAGDLFELPAKEIIDYTDRDFPSMEFQREPLMPYQNSSPGPVLAVSDVNGDGRDDLFIGGAKRQSASLFLQKADSNFEKHTSPAFETDKLNEDSDALFVDADNDGDPDLIVGSGGNEFTSGRQLALRFYENRDGEFIRDHAQFERFEQNVSAIRAADVNGDGHVDLFVGVNSVPGSFGETPPNFLFENRGDGTFRDVTGEKAPMLREIGLVYDATWADMDGDGAPDLVLAGHFMPVTVLYNRNGELKYEQTKSGLENTHGFWNEVETADLDGDGDPDIVAGNWGLNSRLVASEKEPIRLYRADFDNNGNIEPILTYYYQGSEMIFANRDELGSQLPVVKKNYLSYTEFAKAGFHDILPKSGLAQAEKKKVNKLTSAVFINEGNGKFSCIDLPVWAQFAPVWAILPDDIDHDGLPDLILGGNTFGLNTQLGRMDGLKLTVLKNKKGDKPDFERITNVPPVSGEIRDLKTIGAGNHRYLLVARNNEKLSTFRIK